MSARVCRECGADTWKASNYDELAEARDRHWRKNQEQAQTILRLELRVAELEGLHQSRQRKINRQAKVIRRLEERLRSLSVFPHEGASLTGTSPVPQDLSPSEDDGIGPSPRGMRQMRKRAAGGAA